MHALMPHMAGGKQEPHPPSWILAFFPTHFVVVPSTRIQIASNCLVISRPEGDMSIVRREANSSLSRDLA